MAGGGQFEDSTRRISQTSGDSNRATSQPPSLNHPQIDENVQELGEQSRRAVDGNLLNTTLTTANMTGQDDEFLSPMVAADGNHLSPYAHLSDHLSDSAYDNFSDYDYTTPDFGDDLSEIAYQTMVDDNQTVEPAIENRLADAASDVTSNEHTPSTGDSIKHPSTRLLSPVLTNPSLSRTGTPGGLLPPADVANNSSRTQTMAGESSQSVCCPPGLGPSISLDSVIDVHQQNRGSNLQTESSTRVPEESSQISKTANLSSPSSVAPGKRGNQKPKKSDGTQSPLATAKFGDQDRIKNKNVSSPIRRGVDPDSRIPMNQETIPSLEDEEKQRELAATKEGVEKWLNTTETIDTETSITTNDQSVARHGATQGETQATTVEKVSEPQTPAADTPGPGVLVNHEDDDTDDEDDRSEAAFSEMDDTTPPAPHQASGTINTPSDITGTRDPTTGRRPWVDSPAEPDSANPSGQPSSSNAAMARFQRQVKDTETASVTATIGSSHHRRSLESLFSSASLYSTNISVVPPSETGSISNSSRVPLGAERQTGLLSKFLRGRSHSNLLKRREPNESESKIPEIQETKEHPGTSPIKRAHSYGLSPKSPSLSPSSPNRTPLSPTLHQHKTSSGLAPAWASVTGRIRKARSRSDLSGGSALAEKWISAGGPPVANLRPSSPSAESERTISVNKPIERQDSGLGIDDDDEHTPTAPVDMSMGPLSIPSDATAESFRAHALEANPRIQRFLLERITSEQIKRCRRLVEARLNHDTQVGYAQCEAKDFCSVLGTGPRSLPTNKFGTEQESTFYIQRNGLNGEAPGPADNDSYPANFPEGIPLPPLGVDRLPAEFECPLCFKVKKIRKPSDWTKHVHEDLQPFTCSFPDCGEPKSFKRKADWVRHENERHRQLETWVCNFADCQHVCHRKDNFVQHLVREHKMPEPKVRASKGSVDSGVDHGAVSRLVEICRRDTDRSAAEEACRFCGNYLKNWKKLSGHLAKHMEHISLPVLSLAARQTGAKQSMVTTPVDQESRYSNRGSAAPPANVGAMGVPTTSSNYITHEPRDTRLNSQSQRYPQPVGSVSGSKIQGHDIYSDVSGYGMAQQSSTQGMAPLVTQSLPGAANAAHSHAEFGVGGDASYTTASPNETFTSVFTDSANILPRSASHGVSMTYPPSYATHSQAGQHSLQAGISHQSSAYANEDLYSGGDFGSAHYVQQNYQYSQLPATTSAGQYIQGTGMHYTARDSSHTPTSQFQQLGTSAASVTPTHQYTPLPNSAYSTTTSSFPPSHLDAYVQPQRQPGYTQAYGSASQGQVSNYLTSGTQYSSQAGTQGQSTASFDEQSYQQRRQQPPPYGRYY